MYFMIMVKAMFTSSKVNHLKVHWLLKIITKYNQTYSSNLTFIGIALKINYMYKH